MRALALVPWLPPPFGFDGDADAIHGRCFRSPGIRRQGFVDAKLQRKMLHIDAAYHIIIHITEISVGRMCKDLQDAQRTRGLLLLQRQQFPR